MPTAPIKKQTDPGIVYDPKSTLVVRNCRNANQDSESLEPYAYQESHKYRASHTNPGLDPEAENLLHGK
ncbi:hypothetical protein D3C77_604730 [compost metagenome]